MDRLLLLSCLIWLNVTARAENISPTIDSVLSSADQALTEANFALAQQLAADALKQYQEGQWSDPSAQVRLYDILGNIALEQSALDTALILFQKGLEVAESDPSVDKLELAKIYNDLGNYHMEMRAFEPAAQRYQQALKIREKHYEWGHPELANSHSNLGNFYLAMGSDRVADKWFSSALRMRRQELPAIHPDLASSYYNLADLRFYQNDYKASFDYAEQAKEIRSQLYPEGHPSLGRSWLQIARYQQAQGQLTPARKAYQTAIQIFRLFPSQQKDIANWHTRMGNSLEAEGRYAQALSQYDSAYQLRSTLFEVHSSISESLNDMGNCYANLGDYGNALYIYQEALRVLEESPYQDQLYLSALYENLGTSSRRVGRLEEGLVYLEEAYGIKAKTLGANDPDLGTSLINLGNAYLDLQQFAEAENYYKQALTIAERAFGLGHISTLLPINNLGIFYYNQRQHEQALAYFTRAYEVAKASFPDRSPALAKYLNNISLAHGRLGNPDQALNMAEEGLALFSEDQVEIPAAYLSLLQSKARSLLAKSNEDDALLQAYETYAKATSFLDATRLIYEDDLSRQTLVASNFEIFEGALSCLHALIEKGVAGKDWEESAFHHFEKSKSLSLLDALLRSKGLNFNDLPTTLKERENLILDKIGYWEKRRYDWLNSTNEGSNRDSIIQLNQEIAKWKGEHRALMDEVKQMDARYYQLKYDQQLISSDRVREELLKGDKGLIEYFLGQEHLYIFVLTADEKQLFKVPSDFPLERWMANIREAITAFPTASTESANIFLEVFADYTHRIYEKVFAPLTKQKLPKELIIIPDGALSYLPFELLLEEYPEKITRFKSYTYLIKKHQISYAFSATLLHQMVTNYEVNPSKFFLGVAPSFAPDGPFEPLAYNQQEVERIGELMKSAQVSKYATVEEFKASAPAYNIIHLATHGVLNDKADAFSYIALSPDSIEQDQGVLFTRDLYDMRLNAAMVVLSACETGLGKYQRGEGIISLARGFAYAGAKSTLTTLWSIDDETTKELMYQFYENIQQKMPKDEALHLA
nr:CHAT domain-containing protein [Saprospiraceae bacterium]